MTAEDAILELLANRAPDKTICPSEAARLLADGGDDWRRHMDAVHSGAIGLSARGLVILSQKGTATTSPKGAYRIASARATRDE